MNHFTQSLCCVVHIALMPEQHVLHGKCTGCSQRIFDTNSSCLDIALQRSRIYSQCMAGMSLRRKAFPNGLSSSSW